MAIGDAASTRTSILHLPQDLQAQCLKHLGVRERVTLARVCRAWRSLVYESSLLWDRMELWLATSNTGSTGRFSTLLEQLRRMGETTTELELLLGPPCYLTGETPPGLELVLKPRNPTGLGGSISWTGFDLQQLLAAFPRLRSLRLIQTPPSVSGRSYRGLAPGLSLDQLRSLCQSCTGLVQLGINPVCVFVQDLEAVVACLERLPHLRCLSMAVDSSKVQQGPALQHLSSLTRLKQLRCVVHPDWHGEVEKTRKALSGLVNLQALELTGVKWLLVRGPDQGFPLPPGLTRLAIRALAWEVLLPHLSTLRLQSLSVWLDKDSECDLGSVTCLTQLTQLVGAPTCCHNPESFGGGLVLPQVQRLALEWGSGRGLPPVVDWTSLGCLTYLCLKAFEYGTGVGEEIDLRHLAKLNTLVIQGYKHRLGAVRIPRSLTGLQVEECYWDTLPDCLVDMGLCSLVLLGCPKLSWTSANFRDTVSRVRSLRSFHAYLTSHQAACMGEGLPGTEQAGKEWAHGVELEFRRLLPSKLGACTVAFQSDWDRDGSGRPAACLKRQADPDDLFSQLRVYGELR